MSVTPQNLIPKTGVSACPVSHRPPTIPHPDSHWAREIVTSQDRPRRMRGHGATLSAHGTLKTRGGRTSDRTKAHKGRLAAEGPRAGPRHTRVDSWQGASDRTKGTRKATPQRRTRRREEGASNVSTRPPKAPRDPGDGRTSPRVLVTGVSGRRVGRGVPSVVGGDPVTTVPLRRGLTVPPSPSPTRVQTLETPRTGVARQAGVGWGGTGFPRNGTPPTWGAGEFCLRASGTVGACVSGRQDSETGSRPEWPGIDTKPTLLCCVYCVSFKYENFT